jgi:hypothetical protein
MTHAWFHPFSNNAGKYADRFAVSEDGVEMTFATNYLGTASRLNHRMVTILLQIPAGAARRLTVKMKSQGTSC